VVREIDNGSLVVNEGDVVIVSNTRKRQDGFFSKVGISELNEGEALVGLRPVINDKTRHSVVSGKLLPNSSPEISVLLDEMAGEFVEGKGVFIYVPNKLDRVRYFIGKKLLGW